MKLAVQDVAAIFNVSEKTVYRWIKNSGLPAYRINDQYRFNRTELIEWANHKRVNFSSELFNETESESEQCAGLADSLESGGVYFRLGGASKEEVLRELVRVIRVPDDVDPEFLLSVLLARENLGSTGIGDGIAIPHARMPVLLHVSQPSVSLCFLEQPVEFGALDGKPVSTLFTIISPTIRAHLSLLSRLGFVLRDEQLRACLAAQESRAQILDSIRRIESGIQTPIQQKA